MARQTKLTTDVHARKDQRERTQQLLDETAGMDPLQKAPPRYLKSYARSAWVRIVPMLQQSGYVKAADRATIEAMCLNYQLLREAYDSVKSDGVIEKVQRTVVNNKTGEVYHDDAGWKRNPASQIIDSATAKLNSLAHELGLTPAARASLLKLNDPGDEDEPSLAAQLRGKSDF